MCRPGNKGRALGPRTQVAGFTSGVDFRSWVSTILHIGGMRGEGVRDRGVWGAVTCGCGPWRRAGHMPGSCPLGSSTTQPDRVSWECSPGRSLCLTKSSACGQFSRSVVSDSLRPHRLQPAKVPQSMGFSRQEYWSGLPCPPPRDPPGLGIEPVSLMSPELASVAFRTQCLRVC